MTSLRTRLFAVLTFVLPVAALVASPAMAASKAKIHHPTVHKISHKTSHKSKSHVAS